MKISNIFIYGKGFKKIYFLSNVYVFWVLGTYIVPVVAMEKLVN